MSRNSTQFFNRLLVFILEIVQNCAGSSKLGEQVYKNDWLCGNVRKMAKSAIPHMPHLNVASAVGQWGQVFDILSGLYLFK